MVSYYCEAEHTDAGAMDAGGNVMEVGKKCVNDVFLVGRRTSDFSYSRRVQGIDYYVAEFASERLSGAIDRIPVRVSEGQRALLSQNSDGYVRIRGHFQSFNRNEQGRRRLLLSVLAKTVDFPEGAGAAAGNLIYLEGYVCRETVYRNTWNGMRITDILLAVNRPYKGADYLPCISWGRYARMAAGFHVGERIWLRGRIQSRDYCKDTDGVAKAHRAYEVSASEVGSMARPAAGK